MFPMWLLLGWPVSIPLKREELKNGSSCSYLGVGGLLAPREGS